MQNVQLIGVQHVDRFNLRTCVIVMAVFTVITVISYFNELGKAGLLRRGSLMTSSRSFLLADNVRGLGQATVVVNKDGDSHNLGLNFLALRKSVQGNASIVDPKAASGQPGGGDDEGEETDIQLHLHLGKQTKYELDNDTQVYKYHKTMPNFFLKIADAVEALPTVYPPKDSSTTNATYRYEYENFFNYLHLHATDYQDRTKVLFYQHDPNGYATRDCFVRLAVDRKLVTGRAPLSAIYRKDWEAMPMGDKSKYEALYGGLSFGACEGMAEACSYSAMMSHPLDRLLKAYSLCKSNASRTMCRFLRVQNSSDIRQFLQTHGSSTFQKLLYYSRHCRLIGDDEVCIHDNTAYFVLSPEDKAVYLEDILENLDQWFSVIGIMDNAPLSMALFNSVLGLNFPECLSRSLTSRKVHSKRFFSMFRHYHYFKFLDESVLDGLTVDGEPYLAVRETLLVDPHVLQWLSPDLRIYGKALDIFQRQAHVFEQLKTKLSSYYQRDKSHVGTKKIDAGKAVDTVDIAKLSPRVPADVKTPHKRKSPTKHKKHHKVSKTS